MKSLPIPLNDCVLVALDSSPYKMVAATEGKYDSRTSGTIVAVDEYSEIIPDDIMNRTGYWREYKDDCRIKIDDKLYALVEYKDILGVSDAD